MRFSQEKRIFFCIYAIFFVTLRGNLIRMQKIHFILLTIGVLACSLGVRAESRLDRLSMRHEIRVGWGDQLFETMAWHEPSTMTIIPANPYLSPQDFREQRKENYTYYQHVFAEYHYRSNDWFSVGVMLDGSGFSWENVVRDGKGSQVGDPVAQYCLNMVLMPTMRFTYYWHENVNIYSGLGFGMDVNSGTETDIRGRKTVVGAVADLRLLGVSANYKRCFAAVEIGGMIALENANAIFLFGSKMFTASIGVRF